MDTCFGQVVVISLRTDNRSEMALQRVTCRLCLQSIKAKHGIGLFIMQELEQDLGSHLSRLILVPVSIDDHLSKHVSRKCNNAAVSSEQQLQELQGMAQRSYHLMCKDSAESEGMQEPGDVSRKRPKDTSGGPFISPHTARVQPPVKKQFVGKRLFTLVNTPPS